MSDVSRLVISARLEDVRNACDFVVDAAEAAGLDERAVYHCQMAVDEALTNIIEHGYSFNGDMREIAVEAETDDGYFVIRIIDDSPAFNPLEHEAPDPDAPLDTRTPGGWGIYFIRKLMDEVEYEHADGFNRLILYKALPDTDDAAIADISGDTFPTRTLDDGAIVVSPAGRLDSNTSHTLEKVLNAQLHQGHKFLYVDMSDVEYIASSGLKVLVSAWRRARESSGDIVLSSLQPRIVEIFEMVGFDMLFDIYPDLDTAVAARPGAS